MGFLVKWGARIVSFLAGIGIEQVADRVTGSDDGSKATRVSFGTVTVLLVSLSIALYFIFKPKKRKR